MQILKFKHIEFKENFLQILDQSLLPNHIVYRKLKHIKDFYKAIKEMWVRGAPLIGVVAAYGVAIEAINSKDKNVEKLKRKIKKGIELLRKSRPTAYNLFWALNQMEKICDSVHSTEELKEKLIEEAKRIHKEDQELCYKIGQHGEKLIRDGMRILTHCNAGALATAGIGTALAPIYLAHLSGKKIKVYASETRPALQGARLTAWELVQNGIDTVLICDNVRATLFSRGEIDLCIVGADRIARNGDVANKIGTLDVALLCQKFNVPFYVAAPYSTFDPNISSGKEIPIEERDEKEVKEIMGVKIAPREVKVYNPVFDVTPAELVTGYITEKGILKKEDIPNLKQ